MSGVTMRSVMSVSTVKVGTTMKSMKPGDRSHTKHNSQFHSNRRAYLCLRRASWRTCDGVEAGETYRSGTGRPWWTCGRTAGRMEVRDLPPCPPGKRQRENSALTIQHHVTDGNGQGPHDAMLENIFLEFGKN